MVFVEITTKRIKITVGADEFIMNFKIKPPLTFDKMKEQIFIFEKNLLTGWGKYSGGVLLRAMYFDQLNKDAPHNHIFNIFILDNGRNPNMRVVQALGM